MAAETSQDHSGDYEAIARVLHILGQRPAYMSRVNVSSRHVPICRSNLE